MIPTLATFIQFIDQLMEACDTSEVQMPKLWKGSKISNSTILARLISFCNCSQLDQDESEEESTVHAKMVKNLWNRKHLTLNLIAHLCRNKNHDNDTLFARTN